MDYFMFQLFSFNSIIIRKLSNFINQQYYYFQIKKLQNDYYYHHYNVA
jgi:hypothetical protein